MSDTSIKGDIRAALSNENLRGAGRFADDLNPVRPLTGIKTSTTCG